MEPTNPPFRKENDLPNLHEDMFHVNLQGCTCDWNSLGKIHIPELIIVLGHILSMYNPYRSI